MESLGKNPFENAILDRLERLAVATEGMLALQLETQKVMEGATMSMLGAMGSMGLSPEVPERGVEDGGSD